MSTSSVSGLTSDLYSLFLSPAPTACSQDNVTPTVFVVGPETDFYDLAWWLNIARDNKNRVICIVVAGGDAWDGVETLLVATAEEVKKACERLGIPPIRCTSSKNGSLSYFERAFDGEGTVTRTTAVIASRSFFVRSWCGSTKKAYRSKIVTAPDRTRSLESLQRDVTFTIFSLLKNMRDGETDDGSDETALWNKCAKMDSRLGGKILRGQELMRILWMKGKTSVVVMLLPSAYFDEVFRETMRASDEESAETTFLVQEICVDELSEVELWNPEKSAAEQMEWRAEVGARIWKLGDCGGSKSHMHTKSSSSDLLCGVEVEWTLVTGSPNVPTLKLKK